MWGCGGAHCGMGSLGRGLDVSLWRGSLWEGPFGKRDLRGSRLYGEEGSMGKRALRRYLS